MAGLWYRTGSVAVTQSSKKITGTGTSWLTALNRPSKGNVFYGPDGKAYEIDYISSETELYLVDAYAGAAATGQSYKIDVRGGTVPELSRQLSEHYAYMQGIIDSLQSIVSGSGDVTISGPSGQTVTVPALANMLSKSGNLAGLADKATSRRNLGISAFSDTLLDDADAAAMRSTLGLVKQTTNADSTPGRLLLVGSGGICAAGAIPSVPNLTNCDDIAVSGFYSVNAGTTNWAFGSSGGVIMHMAHGATKYQTQLAFSSTGEIIKYRTNPNGVWGSWKDLLHTGNTVKQTGNYDTTSGALLSVGAFGINGVGPLIESADFNSKVVPGRYFMQATSSSNSPNSAMPLILEVEVGRVDTGGGGGRIRQIASGYGTNEGYIWSRSSPDAGSSWTGWKQHWNGQVMPYESGAFTPTVFGSTTAGITTYSSQAGRYTRIGERVFFDMVLQWTAATGTGNLCIGGLPFTSKAGAISAQMSVAVQNMAGSVPISALLGSSVNYMVIRSMANGANWTDVAMDPAAEIRISGSYVIA